MRIFTLVVMLFLFLTSALNAQTAYTVQPGDTGWELARTYYDDPVEWRAIVRLNPILQEPGRVFERDGRIILLLHPGDELVGLERLGVAAPRAVPIEQLLPATVPEATAITEASAPTGFNWWLAPLWLFLLAATISVCWLAYTTFRDNRRRAEEQHRREAREAELRRDPITSGTPFVPGGIPATDTPRLANFFDQQAANRYAERNPHLDRATIRPTRIGPIEEGTITGEGQVGYLGGETRARRIEQPIAAYRARYRFPDGTEEVITTLQPCMNPVSMGGDTYTGFTFTPRTEAVPAPGPERPAPQPVPTPAMAVRAIRTAAGEDGNTTVTIGGRVLVFERGVHLTVDEATGEVGMEGQSFRMTLKPKRQARTRASKPRATGTTGN